MQLLAGAASLASGQQAAQLAVVASRVLALAFPAARRALLAKEANIDSDAQGDGEGTNSGDTNTDAGEELLQAYEGAWRSLFQLVVACTSKQGGQALGGHLTEAGLGALVHTLCMHTRT